MFATVDLKPSAEASNGGRRLVNMDTDSIIHALEEILISFEIDPYGGQIIKAVQFDAFEEALNEMRGKISQKPATWLVATQKIALNGRDFSYEVHAERHEILSVLDQLTALVHTARIEASDIVFHGD